MAEAIRFAKYSELLNHENDMVSHLSEEDRARMEEAIVRAGGHVHRQDFPDSVWTIRHDLNKCPSVSCYTLTSGHPQRIIGDVEYPDFNTVAVKFSVVVSGIAYLN